MATQMGIAFSETIKGVGVFAGGAYYCAEGDQLFVKKKCINPKYIDVDLIGTAINYFYSQGQIDNPSNLNTSKVFFFGGKLDHEVPIGAVQKN